MRATMSRAALLLQCQWWAQYCVRWDEDGSDAAQADTNNHAELERAVRGEAAADWAQAAVLDVPNDARAEVKLAWDPRAVRSKVLSGGPRDYSGADTGDFCGTADLTWTEGRTLVVRDWKTGERARENTEPAGDNAQLGALALALNEEKCADLDFVRVEIGFVSPTSPLEVDAHTLTVAELWSRWRDRFTDALSAVYNDPEPTPGAGCKWCPARNSCPVATRSIAAVERLAAMTEQEILSTAIESPEHAGALYVRAKLAQSFLDKVFGALKAYATEHAEGLPIGDGKLAKVREKSRRSIEVDAVPPERMAELRASGLVVESIHVGKVPKEMMAQLDAAGAVKVTTYTELAEVNAEPRKRGKKAA